MSILSVLTLVLSLLLPIGEPQSAATQVSAAASPISTATVKPVATTAQATTTPAPAPQTAPAPAPVVATPAPAPRCKDTATATNTVVIEDICLNANMQRVGLTANGEIDTPVSNIGLWGVEPGQPGTALLDGHVFGVFSRLPSIHNGATISINSNGTVFTYRVIGTETIALDQLYQNGKWDSILFPNDGQKHATFITCAGHSLGGGQYSHRFFVYAILQP